MKPKSATDLEAKWKGCPWCRRPSDAPADLPPSRNHLNLRLRRALSWLGRAEREYCAQDFDAAFVFYWIAFNAMYGQLGTASVDEKTEKERRCEYIDRIFGIADAKKVLRAAVASELRDEIPEMLNNRYVFEPYWWHHNNPAENRNWARWFEDARKKANEALWNGHTKDVLNELFYRLYTLRNQLLHGGATWSSSVNRNQVKPGAKIMRCLVPYFLDMMIDHPDEDWGPPRYPLVIENAPLSGLKPVSTPEPARAPARRTPGSSRPA